MEYIGYFFAILLGFLLKTFGSGGSLIALPVFVYLFHIPLLEATTYSLFVVTIGAFISVLMYLKRKIILPFAKILSFVIPSVVVVILTRLYIVDLLPLSLTIKSIQITQEMYLMTLFSLLGITAGYTMLKPVEHKHAHHKPYMLSLFGGFIGFLTGIFGTGGGFLIVPALRRYGHIETNKAVVASLSVVTINSAIGFATSFAQTQIRDTQLLLFFTLNILLGIWLGSSQRFNISQSTKEKVLGYLIIAVSLISGVLAFI